MSFFNKMKAGLQNVANRVTGGYGEVELEFNRHSYYPGQVVEARVLVKAKEDLKVTRITAQLEGREELSFRDSDWEPDTEATRRHSESLFENHRDIAGEFELAAGDQKEFVYQVGLPPDLPPSCSAEHLKSVYRLKVDVDIPWGVDLHALEEIKVLGRPDPQMEIESRHQNPAAAVRFSLSKSCMIAGEKAQWNISLRPRETILVKKITARYRSVECFEAELRRRIEERPEWTEGEEAPEPRVRYESEKRRIEVVADETLDDLSGSHRINTSGISMGGWLTLPEDLPPTYRRGGLEHKIVLHVAIEIAEREPLEFSEELVVFDSGRLRELGVGYSEESFRTAVAGDQTEVVQLFLDSGMDPATRLPARKIDFSDDLGAALTQMQEEGAKFKEAVHEGGVVAHLAARSGALDSLRMLLESGADPEAVDGNGEGLLHAAARGQSREAVDLLMERGLDLEAGAEDGSTPLMAAARTGQTGMLGYLLEKGADASARNNHGHGPLHLAAAFGHAETVKFLVEQGFAIDEPISEGATPLWIACAQGENEVVSTLLDMGAGANTPGKDGKTPLHIALATRNLPLAQTLQAAGADLFAQDDRGRNLVHIACGAAFPEGLEWALEQDVELAATDSKGMSALHYSAQAGDMETAKILLPKGAEMNAVDEEGRTPLTVAKAAGHSKMGNFLYAMGCRDSGT